MLYKPVILNTVPLRAQPLLQAGSLTPESWALVRDAVRPDLRTNYLERVPRALNAHLPDAALNYIWNLVEHDLRDKVLAYGISYFASALNKPKLRTRDDLVDDVKSMELLQGCFALGIIGDEAYFYLQHCRDIRNHYTAAHMTETELDPLETANFIKNCVKYALCHDLPPAGFSIKDFLDHVGQSGADLEEAYALLEVQASTIYGALAHSFFDHWMDATTPSELRAAIKKLAPKLWDLLGEDTRNSVAMRYLSIKQRPTPNDASLALEFLKVVGGVDYIPEDFRALIFKRHADDLLAAYDGPNNFYKEGPHARALLELGHAVPVQAAKPYIKAALLSYVGNCYGYCWAAAEHDKVMIENASPTVMGALKNVLATDASVISALTNRGPAERFRGIASTMRGKATDAALQGFLDAAIAGQWNTVVNEMHSRLSKLAKK